MSTSCVTRGIDHWAEDGLSRTSSRGLHGITPRDPICCIAVFGRESPLGALCLRCIEGCRSETPTLLNRNLHKFVVLIAFVPQVGGHRLDRWQSN
jgi:hypothetical protein